jgi:hypothetical protein
MANVFQITIKAKKGIVNPFDLGVMMLVRIKPI